MYFSDFLLIFAMSIMNFIKVKLKYCGIFD